MGLAFLLQPWTLTAAGAASITSSDTSQAATVVTLAGFVVLSASSYVTMEVYAWKEPAKAGARMEALRIWIDDHRDAAIIWLSLVVGLWLIGHAAYLLASA
jgi:Sap, sulfolipid-1-addressing protein